MEMAMIGERQRGSADSNKKKKRQKWNLAAPIIILFVSEKMGRGSCKLLTVR